MAASDSRVNGTPGRPGWLHIGPLEERLTRAREPGVLAAGQWLTCAAVGSAILWTGEVVKIVLRASHQPGAPLGQDIDT